jgi:hypothetical protein
VPPRIGFGTTDSITKSLPVRVGESIVVVRN